MAKVPVFFSFHFEKDVMRVQQVRNMGALEGNVPVSPNDWEQLRRAGNSAIRKWIDDAMKYRRCVVVLVGEQTAYREWVRYEIEKAWSDERAVVGVRIHNLKCPQAGLGIAGPNPFSSFRLQDGRRLSDVVTLHDPNPANAYNDIEANLSTWVNMAILSRSLL